MSRAYRKLMRERDGLVPLAVQPKQNTNSLNPDNEVTTDEEGEGDSQHPAGGQQSLFALLGGDDVDSDESDEEGADSDTAKGLKAATTTAAATVNGQDNDEDDAEDDEEEERIGKPAAKRKSKKKKNKKKGKGGGKEVVVENEGKGKGKGKAVEDGMDEIDRTLRELNEKFGDILTPTSTEPTNPNNTDSARRDLLSIDPRWLDADAEMRKMFGSRVVNDEIRRKKYIRSAKRTALAVPREHWPKPDKLGLTMELESTADDGTLYFTFVHSRAYQEIQHVFIQCVNTHDPNTIQNLLQMYPYHIDTLLQLSEIAKHGGDIAMAAELVERALYAFERAFHSMFNAATGLARLPYQRFENRAFHLALFRHIGYLARRGCWRTSFEFAKFLLALDIDADPLGTLYSIDAYALNAKEEEWYLRFVDAYQESLGLLDYPNHAYSLALAKWAVEAKNHKSSSSSLHAESTTLLHTAIRTFPTLIPLLLDKCGSSVAGVTPDTPFFVDETDSLALRLQVELYVERAHSMWKVPEVLAWLREGVKSVLAEGGERGSGVGEGEVPRNLSRHIFISGMSCFHQPVSSSPTAIPLTQYSPPV
ncbi:transcriptional repressor TCF25-domain-containing protein [Fimicolochytrium jonesii]|uniref:transcriptional repressor TCF25-domain-containing protein n=1 Tax=Fimicolochytrium jonesii TaxID=1396493 RepID=UPI0022FF3F03|nr:transcriptional repressor TCF25-domain-containing protein [Fimicolochytrium jonesii]KAI8824541.1 transcriptional repressor TCF25-domain-containing protein [Fimicolochytrium jonesii]